MISWRGIFKLMEECAELSQELAKLAAFPAGRYPRRTKNLRESVVEEMADVQAAMIYFRRRNFTSQEEAAFAARVAQKVELYHDRTLSGVVKTGSEEEIYPPED